MKKEFENNLVVYIDGGSKGNPGASAIAYLIYNQQGNIIKSKSKKTGLKTNNQAEYLSFIEALKEVKKLKPRKITLFSDSELLVNHLNNSYKIKEKSLIPYFIKAHNLFVDLRNKIKINLIPRSKNKEADRMVKKELTS